MSIFIILWKSYALQPVKLTLRSFSYQCKNAQGSTQCLRMLLGK